MEHISAAHNGQYSILLKNKWNRQFSTNKIIPLFLPQFNKRHN